MKIPGIDNKVMFAAHKESWVILRNAVDKALQEGVDISNIDVTGELLNISEGSSYMTIRLKLIK